MKNKAFAEHPPATPVTDLRAIRSRESLRHALLTLLQAKSLGEITTRDITDTARVGYATFYRHYASKEALLNDLAAEQVNHLVDLTLPIMDKKDSLGACTLLCRYVRENEVLWKTLMLGGAASTIREALLAASRVSARTRAKTASWLPTDLGVVLVSSSIVELLTWWLNQPDPLPVEQVGNILDKVVLAPTINDRQDSTFN